VEEVHGQHARSLGAQELSPCCVVRPQGAGGTRRCLRIRRIVEAPTLWPSLRSSPSMRW
jgi:hypothetical protein